MPASSHQTATQLASNCRNIKHLQAVSRGTPRAISQGMLRYLLSLLLALAFVQLGPDTSPSWAQGPARARRPSKQKADKPNRLSPAGRERLSKFASSRSRKKDGTFRSKKGALISVFAKQRARGEKKQFAPVAAKDRAIRSKRVGMAITGGGVSSSPVTIEVTPASGARAGSLRVEIPEHYVGSTQVRPGTRAHTLYVTDIRGNTVAIQGVMKLGGTGYNNAYSKMELAATIPAGAAISQRALQEALGRSLRVLPTTKWQSAGER